MTDKEKIKAIDQYNVAAPKFYADPKNDSLCLYFVIGDGSKPDGEAVDVFNFYDINKDGKFIVSYERLKDDHYETKDYKVLNQGETLSLQEIKEFTLENKSYDVMLAFALISIVKSRFGIK